MYYALGLFLMAVVSYALGYSTGRELLRREVQKSLEEVHASLLRLEKWLKGEDDEDPLDPDEALYDTEIGVDEYLTQTGDGVWLEVEITNECGYGCKVYEHSRTGRRTLAHNSAYGCKRSFNMNKE